MLHPPSSSVDVTRGCRLEVNNGIPRDGDLVEVVHREPRLTEAGVDRLDREDAAHLHPVEAFLGYRRDDTAVIDNARGADIHVVTYPENSHAASQPLTSAIARATCG